MQRKKKKKKEYDAYYYKTEEKGKNLKELIDKNTKKKILGYMQVKVNEKSNPVPAPIQPELESDQVLLLSKTELKKIDIAKKKEKKKEYDAYYYKTEKKGKNLKELIDKNTKKKILGYMKVKVYEKSNPVTPLIQPELPPPTSAKKIRKQKNKKK